MKTCLIIQSLALGDILLCLPIAAHYAKLGYTVYWPVRQQFIPTLLKCSYAKPILLDESVRHADWLKSDVLKILDLDIYKTADLVLNLADRGPHPTAQLPGENWEKAKWRLSGLPFSLKHTLTWTRDFEKENELKELVCPAGPYVFAHLSSSHMEEAEMPVQDLPVVKARIIEGYSIFDWIGIILDSSAIYCTESSFFNLVDGIITRLKQPCYLLKRQSLLNGYRYCYAEHWSKKYIGETRVWT